MRRRSISRFAAAASLWGAAALSGCGNMPGASGPSDGILTVTVKPATIAVSGLQLTSARTRVENMTVLGDVAADSHSMLSEFNLDLLASAASFTLSTLPQGVYSRVRFGVDHANFAGSWRGMPLTVSLEADDAVAIDLRSAGVEVTPGHDGALAVDIDAAAWFGGDILDSATPAQGQLVVDGSHNQDVAAQIVARIPASFTLHDDVAPVR